jgi:hypothetical protein
MRGNLRFSAKNARFSIGIVRFLHAQPGGCRRWAGVKILLGFGGGLGVFAFLFSETKGCTF